MLNKGKYITITFIGLTTLFVLAMTALLMSTVHLSVMAVEHRALPEMTLERAEAAKSICRYLEGSLYIPSEMSGDYDDLCNSWRAAGVEI
jgi:hypothetical protein